MTETKRLLKQEFLTRPDLLDKHHGRYFPMRGRNISTRTDKLHRHIMDRLDAGIWPYGLKVIETKGTHIVVENDRGIRLEGVNFTAIDYLGLARHPRLKTTALEATERYGVHSSSSGALMGNHFHSELLAERTAEFLHYPHVCLFPSGWSASFGAITAVIRAKDHVVIDELAHQSLQQGAFAATTNVHKFPHLDNAAVETILRDIRLKEPDVGILVVTEGLYSMDGDAPDLAGLLSICRVHEAYMCVDVCHDLGCTGPGGTGTLGHDGLLGEVDIVCGSYSKTFGTGGGFVATKHQGIDAYLFLFTGPHTYSTAMSPASSAVASEAIRIVQSAEGEALRANLALNSQRMRELCTIAGLTTYGTDTPIVPVIIGSEAVARITGALGFERGLIAPVLEFPVVKLNTARYRLSMTACHTEEDIQQAVTIMTQAIPDAEQIVDKVFAKTEKSHAKAESAIR